MSAPDTASPRFPCVERLPEFPFHVESRDGRARAGRLSTPRGDVLTPCFMPVGTKGTVKAMRPDRLEKAGARIILANTYHLALRPGSDVVKSLGGLHRFMAWTGPILTDSGGFQVFSLKHTAKVDDEGVAFDSVYDGARRLFTPEKSIEEQQQLGADIIMCFDECPPGESPRSVVREAVRRTGVWASRCKETHLRAGGYGTDGPQMLLGIVQGGTHIDLRARSAEELCAIGFPGYAIGGLSVGEERGRMLEVTEHTATLLPQDKVRYFMGVGDPAGVLDVIERGVDLFDCVLPTRTARMGTAFTREGRVNLRNARHTRSTDPLEPGCPCTACRAFSKGVLRHLVLQKEILGLELLSEHNLTFMIRLVATARQAITEGRFAAFKRECSTQW